MKIIKLLLPICFLLLCTTAALADEQSHRKLAAEFMKLTAVEELMSKVFDQIKEDQLQRIATDEYPGKNVENDRVLHGKIKKYLDEKLVWNSFSKGFEDACMELYSEDELKELVKFFSSPVGKKFKANEQKDREKLLQATAAQLTDFGLKIMEIGRDFVEALKKTLPAEVQPAETKK